MPFTPNERQAAPARPRRRFLLVALVASLIGGAMGALLHDVLDESASPTISTIRGPIANIQPLPGSVAEIAERIRPSVVAIETSFTPADELGATGEAAGTGVVIDQEGHILTNAHVVAQAEQIEVILSGERRLQAKIIGRDPLTDLAVLQAESDGLEPAVLGESSVLRVGDGLIAVGNALNIEEGRSPTVTQGIVSALDRSIETNTGVLLHLIQTDAAINPGNSGGPLLNLAGEVVGINTAVAGGAQNIGFAIAITPAKPLIEELIKTGRVRHPLLGVVFGDASGVEESPVDEGAFITRVEPGSAAQAAGLQVGDVVVEVESQKITSAFDFRKAIQSRKPGDGMRIVVVRGEQRVLVTATLGERP